MSRRITAIAAAMFVLALGSPLIIANANPMAIKYRYQAVDKYENLDMQGSIADFKKAVEIDPQYADAVTHVFPSQQGLEF